MGLLPKELNIKIGEICTISLNSNPSTGYLWKPLINSRYLKIVGHKYERTATKIGSSCLEVFQLKALKKGKYNIEMIYKRHWDEKPIKRSKYVLNVYNT